MFIKWQPDNSEEMHFVGKGSVLKATEEWHPSALNIHCVVFYSRPLMELFSREINWDQYRDSGHFSIDSAVIECKYMTQSKTMRHYAWQTPPTLVKRVLTY